MGEGRNAQRRIRKEADLPRKKGLRYRGFTTSEQDSAQSGRSGLLAQSGALPPQIVNEVGGDVFLPPPFVPRPKRAKRCAAAELGRTHLSGDHIEEDISRDVTSRYEARSPRRLSLPRPVALQCIAGGDPGSSSLALGLAVPDRRTTESQTKGTPNRTLTAR